MPNKNTIASLFTRYLLILLAGFLLFTVCATSVMELVSIARQERDKLQAQAINTLGLIDVQLNAQQRAVIRTAKSQLSINSLIDVGVGGSYFQYALEDLILYTAIEDPHIFDYSGNILHNHAEDGRWFRPELVEDVLVTGQGKSFLQGDKLYFVEPITHYGAVQGGIIAMVNLNDIVSPILQRLNNHYSLTIANSLTYSNDTTKLPSVSVTLSQLPGLKANALPISITLSTPYLALLEEIASWLTSFSILGLFALIPVVAIARRMGQKMATPIVTLAAKVKDGEYPINTRGETSELASLGSAFNLATELVHKANESSLMEERRAGQSQVHAIVDTVVDGIITINSRGDITMFNPAAEGMFGYTASEVMGENIKILMPDHYAREHDGYINNYLQGRPAKIIGIGREITAQRKDGSTFDAELAVSEMRLDGERMFTGVIRDITQRKKDEALKNEFVATVSHELRTPLTSIRGALGLILGKFGDDLSEKNRKMLTLAHRNSERLTLLINDILDIEKLESGQLTLNITRLSLDTVVRRSLEDNEGYARQHNVSLCFDCQVEEAPINGDSIRLQQVMANLLSNAIKYSKPGDEVTVTLKPRADGYCVEVTDVGTGIPPEYHDRIFERFSQADSSDTRRVGGTGLGLAITKAIVEEHQGIINFYSELGKGSTFYFTLPAVVPIASPRYPARTNDLTGYQILYFGCHSEVLARLRASFGDRFEVSDVQTLTELHLAISQQSFELLLLEWPIVSEERECVSEIVQMHIPIVLLSHGDKPFPHPDSVVATCNQSTCDMERLKSELRLILKNTFPREAM